MKGDDTSSNLGFYTADLRSVCLKPDPSTGLMSDTFSILKTGEGEPQSLSDDQPRSEMMAHPPPG